MKKPPITTDDEMQLFRQAVSGSQKLQQDTIRHARAQTKQHIKQASDNQQQRQVDQFFSDDYEPLLDFSRGVEFRQPSLPSHQLKRLRRGDLAPALFLDLHGLSRAEAKQELLALFATSKREWIDVVSVMHGQGMGILKAQLPKWLVQHPDVLAFCEAPREFGGRNALLILLAQDDTRRA
ncbi:MULTISPECIES: endonuclease SmrB [Corallincola]|uniref:Endonuclease SmrB n=2 Tax=Corallincola TaxID=1775176 RepID=A0ABY1WN08_9GAMM|nr:MULTISPECIES: endonuclease SmrB [Corallincola]TAA43801.1 endonuclease SmrB [Corallincola spongiicola]TCI03048.1 endonuclease SmrB [Corallincola luteus]